MRQSAIDQGIQQFYSAVADEGNRLVAFSPAGPVELARVQQIVRSVVPANSRVLDIGGATGVHSSWLAEDGHDVILIDPVPEQVERASQHGTFQALVGDARELPFGDDEFDAVLLFGPLYHLHLREDRVGAIRESLRVLRPGGVLLASAISRVAALANQLAMNPDELSDEVWIAMIRTGDPGMVPVFPVAHFHQCAELESELDQAGCVDVSSQGIEGFADAAEQVRGEDKEISDALMVLAERLAKVEYAKEMSSHLMAIGYKTGS